MLTFLACQSPGERLLHQKLGAYEPKRNAPRRDFPKLVCNFQCWRLYVHGYVTSRGGCQVKPCLEIFPHGKLTTVTSRRQSLNDQTSNLIVTRTRGKEGIFDLGPPVSQTCWRDACVCVCRIRCPKTHYSLAIITRHSSCFHLGQTRRRGG
jgi:hypothetical protein